MSNLTPTARRRKPGDVENPRGIPADLDGTAIPPGIERKVPLGDAAMLPLRMILQLPPGSAMAAAAILDATCGEFARNRNRPVYGVYLSIRKIARLTGLAESTIRTVALPWLVEQGWVESQEITVRGRSRVMLWALWRFPDPAGGCEAGEPPVPVHARMAQKSAPADARISVDTSSNEFFEETKKTTDREVEESSSFVQVSEEKQPIKPPVAPPISPPPAIEPWLAELLNLDKGPPAEPARLEAAARVAAWVARWGLPAVMIAIREARARDARGEKIRNFSAYVDGILKGSNGEPTPRACKAEAEREASEAKARDLERRRAADKARAERKDEERRLAEAEIVERWAALPEPRKQEIRDAAKLKNPALWTRHPLMRPSMELAQMVEEEGAQKDPLPYPPKVAGEGRRGVESD